ncbi:hypothetical protein [Arthrobacter sp. AG258]|uniref:hypothetical protein n=1 Tax=Arthrobacter sp. AG258 TaxID=2183899 RepID=UPI001414E19E|nr:hypothetical protein [Arthrobacter sp. AG258]
MAAGFFYGEHQSWFSKWDDVTRDYTAVDEVFTGHGTKIHVIRHRFLRFFEDCWHLVEWMKRDTELPSSVRERVVKAAWGADPMVLCEAVASTSKHHTREGRNGRPSKASARVSAVMLQQGDWSPRVSITVRQPETSESRDYDARTLAADCMSWWHSFAEQNKLPFPWEG